MLLSTHYKKQYNQILHKVKRYNKLKKEYDNNKKSDSKSTDAKIQKVQRSNKNKEFNQLKQMYSEIEKYNISAIDKFKVQIRPLKK